MRPRKKILYLATEVQETTRRLVIDTRFQTKTEVTLDPDQALAMLQAADYVLFIIGNARHDQAEDLLDVPRWAKDFRPELNVLLIAADSEAELAFRDSLATKTITRPRPVELLENVRMLLKRKTGPKKVVASAALEGGLQACA